MRSASVSRLHITPIKGLRLTEVDQVMVGRGGASGDRRFFLIDERDRKVNSKVIGALHTVSGSFSEEDGVLTLQLPGGTMVSSTVGVDTAAPEQPYGKFRMGRLVSGPWADALSELCGQPLRLVMTESAVDRGTRGAVSLISADSVRRLSRAAGVDGVDARRFRMLIEIDGVPAHTEDTWVGCDVEIGGASLRFEGHVGRCLITCRDPDTGEVTLPTLDVLRSYRDGLDTSEPLAFGVYGRVLTGGMIRVGDSVQPARQRALSGPI